MKIIKEQLSPVGLVSTPSDVDSGTDDTKFLTAKSLADSTKIPTVAPGALGNVMKSDGSKWVSDALTLTAAPFYEYEATEVAPTIVNVLNSKVYSKTGTYSNGIDETTKLWLNAEADNPGDRIGRHSVTNVAAYITTEDKKFGSQAYRTDWAETIHLTGNLEDFNTVANEQWSLDFWFYPDAGYMYDIFTIYAGGTPLFILSKPVDPQVWLQLKQWDPDGTLKDQWIALDLGYRIWKHIAIQRNGNNYSLWVNGIHLMSYTWVLSGTTPKAVTDVMMIPFHGENGNDYNVIDEIRFNLSCQFPLDNTNFTPNNEAYYNDRIYAEDIQFIDGLNNPYSLTKPDWNNIQNIPSSLGDNTLTSLDDTPSTYVGQAGKIATVNNTEDGIEFSPVAKNNYAGTVAPSVSNDSSQGYSIGSTWIDTTSSPKEAYRCTDATVGAAVWINTTFTADEVTPTDWNSVTNKPAFSDETLSVSDVITNNVSTTAHGFAPKGDGDTTKFLNANGVYSIPAGGTGGGGTTAGAFEYFTTVGDNTTTVFDVGFDPADAESTIISINGLIQKPITDYTISGTEVTFIVAPSNLAIIEVRMLGEIKLNASRIVNLDSSMTATDIQALIDAQPKNLGGYTLAFQFGDGTYTLDTRIDFGEFYSGNLNIYGNSADNSLSVTKSVKLYFSIPDGFLLRGNNVGLSIRYLDIRISGASPGACLDISNDRAFIYWNYFHTAVSTSGVCVQTYLSTIEVYATMYGLSVYGANIRSCSIMASDSSDDGGAGNQPVTALVATTSTIMKAGVQPAGSTANESTTLGGVIR